MEEQRKTGWVVLVGAAALALLDALSDSEKEAFADRGIEADRDQVTQLCGRIAPILDLMHQAVAETNCEWDAGRVSAGSPHTFQPGQVLCYKLAIAAMWSADHCRTGDATGIVENLLVTLRMGHNVSQSRLIGFLLDTAIQKLAVDCVAKNAGRIVGSESARLIEELTDAQYQEDFSRAAEQQVNLEISLARKTTPSSLDDPETIQQMAELERELAIVLTQSQSEYETWLSRMRSERVTNLMVKATWLGLEDAVNLARRTIVQHAMVVTGLAVLQSGKDALAAHLDPATGQPFQYQETADGFQLQSAYQFLKQPVTMVFRRQKGGQ